MNILTHQEVTAKFRCVVRAVAVYPWRSEDFRSPKRIFRIRLTLEDPTARIQAYVYAEDGGKFFGHGASTAVPPLFYLAHHRQLLNSLLLQFLLYPGTPP